MDQMIDQDFDSLGIEPETLRIATPVWLLGE